jgi:hypothetical protein
MTCLPGLSTRLLFGSGDKECNSDENFEFILTGWLDSNYAACPDTRRSVSGYSVFVHNAPTKSKCNMQNWVVLSVTEAETASATLCAQSMLFHYRLFWSLGLCVSDS